MRNLKHLLTVLCFVVFSIYKAQSQIVISTPALGFTQACAGTSFNSYNATFSFSPSTSVQANNQFIIELSDPTGDFTNAEIIYTSAEGAITTSPTTISFSFPQTISGEGYRIRIKSTAPAATSTGSVPFPAYYKIQDTPFTINNLIATAVYCAGGSYLLTIDNPGADGNDSPLQYESLSFNWYRYLDSSNTNFVFVASGESLSVSQPGTYFCETDYGSCSSNSYSNRVAVSESTTNGSFEISSSLGNPYCSGDGPTTLSALNGISYQWFLDGAAISGATNQMYQTNESGSYSVTVDLGDCSVSASINLENTGFTSSINVQDVNMLDEGQTITATVTTDAVSPQFTWYRNGTIITGQTSNSITIGQTGNYRVVINQTSGCNASNEFTFTVIEAFPNVPDIPNLISPNGDGINDTWIIPQIYTSGTNTMVTILDSRGKVVFESTDYLNNWPETQIDFNQINPVYYYIIKSDNETKKGSITVIK
ncbi:gliding motility-associated C-terminal domain-containing protein [Gaetbulibacter sp. M240]|uniref:T9SS type B sorting domain-containing protein n=1 Tax=Gaetbulibacter sp. M240 TaxID=3126511 RepID=UPI00374EB426